MAMAVLRQHVIVCSDCPSAYRFSSDAVDVLTRASPSVFGKALPKAFPGAGTLKARRVIRSIYFPPGDESVSAQKGGHGKTVHILGLIGYGWRQSGGFRS